MSGRTASLPEADFGEVFRDAYRLLVRDVIFAGGTLDEAEDPVSAAMVEVLRRWDAITNPRAYARRRRRCLPGRGLGRLRLAGLVWRL